LKELLDIHNNHYVKIITHQLVVEIASTPSTVYQPPSQLERQAGISAVAALRDLCGPLDDMVHELHRKNTSVAQATPEDWDRVTVLLLWKVQEEKFHCVIVQGCSGSCCKD
jgi:hypothetical protein